MSETRDDVAGIAENVARVRERIAKVAERVGRRPEEITLIAATKTQSPERVIAALRAGVTDLGENYVQEARTKIPQITAKIEISGNWHLIGHLQSNKVKYSVELFSLLQSVDNYQLVQEISKLSVKRGITTDYLIEVNLTGNAVRAGIAPDALGELVKQGMLLPNCRLKGLMGMAPAVSELEEARPYFATLYRLWQNLPPQNRQVLSMGMSGDFEAAIAEGATHIRIGTALFGTRQS